MSEEQPEALPVRLAKRLCDGISTGHDWPNTDDELLRMQSAAELRRLHAENEALLAQIGQGEPVAWIRKNGFRFKGEIEPQDDSEVPLYTHPAPQQKPLTDEQIGDVARACYIDVTQDNEDSICAFARAIEAAHNIGDKK